MSAVDWKIGGAAALLGVATHVLRHWEDIGLLTPRRLPSGHRVYDDQTIGQARLIQISQRAGLSLAEIGELVAGERVDRIGLINAKRTRIAEHIANLELADRFLAHLVHCVHPVISDCPECSALVERGARLAITQ
ncbi:MerR family transcriptional regulator [Streptomyces sp. NBC_00887]|uniref:MerR family transcriptional regulator n=1 Tax=Streptomyces sp. NBC_00887 TaxID=2975859 RepID=UPI0038702B5C|nr:MerR family transcriptional regulator [Streptomyces sp. NBC_00887]